MNERRIGLARALSKLGYCSRAQAFDLIRAGKVSVNGKVINDPEFPTRDSRDRIEIEGRSIAAAGKIHLMLNKPRGIIVTASDEKGRDTVYSLLPSGLPWIAPVGRLDKASEGLLLLTNDSEWAAGITDPDSHLDKTYHVQVGTVPNQLLIDAITKGVSSRGESLRAKRATILRSGEKNSWLEVTLDEGRNRQIRRILDSLGVEVLRLVRVSIGPLQLGDLAKGQTRRLTNVEIASLRR